MFFQEQTNITAAMPVKFCTMLMDHFLSHWTLLNSNKIIKQVLRRRIKEKFLMPLVHMIMKESTTSIIGVSEEIDIDDKS